tara:strand:+ start:996 stop:2012 length:1017 start_codon:yes stop_codon:yes gene_type:complete
MPIHLIWGDDYEGITREIDDIIKNNTDPVWQSFNISRLDGQDLKESFKALEEVQSGPLGNGSRVVLIKRSPFCNGCSLDLANKLEQALKVIPDNTHLILYNPNKPDKRLKTTQLIQKSIQNNSLSSEKNYMLPLPWDIKGQRQLVESIALKLNLKMNLETTDLIVESLGNDSSLIYSELQKISLLSEAKGKRVNQSQKLEIKKEIVNELIQSQSTNALEIANLLINSQTTKALIKINALLENGEPALRLVSTLTGQARGWLWVSLLDSQGNQDFKEIAKLAGIANPKRIFVIRKQIQGKSSKILLGIMKKLLNIEASIKSGAKPIDSFKDNLLTESKN